MEKDTLIEELDAYSALSGLGIRTICLKALNNSRFADRYARSKIKMTEDAETLRKFMASNPVPHKEASPPISEGV